MKLLKLFVLGMIIWSISLLWLEINLWLTPAVMTTLALGLLIFLGAYFLGQQFGHTASNDVSLPTPSIRSMGVSGGQNHHSRPTLPLRTRQTQKLHSHPTRPMSVS